MKRIAFIIILLLVGSAPAFADGGETSSSVAPVFIQAGNTWRIVVSSPSNTLTLLSSAPANAMMITSGTFPIGLSAYRERFVVNTCTTAALSLYPTNTGFTQFSTTASLVLSSAPISGTNLVNESNSRYFYHQDNIYGIWDTGSSGAAVGPTPRCIGGAIITESYYSGAQDPTKRR
jgi:hypothetical protein